MSFLKFLSRNNFYFLYLIFFLISFFFLSFAFFAQYFMNLPPCPLCIFQRIPYSLIILFTAVTLAAPKLRPYFFWPILLSLLLSVFLSGYHTLVEKGLAEPSSFCSVETPIPTHLSIEEIKEFLYKKPIENCSKPTLVIFGLSMAEWNFCFSAFLSLFFCFVKRYGKIYAKSIF